MGIYPKYLVARRREVPAAAAATPGSAGPFLARPQPADMCGQSARSQLDSPLFWSSALRYATMSVCTPKSREESGGTAYLIPASCSGCRRCRHPTALRRWIQGFSCAARSREGSDSPPQNGQRGGEHGTAKLALSRRAGARGTKGAVRRRRTAARQEPRPPLRLIAGAGCGTSDFNNCGILTAAAWCHRRAGSFAGRRARLRAGGGNRP